MTAARSTYLTCEFLPSTWRRVRESVLHTFVRGVVHTLYRLEKTQLQHVPEGPAVLVCNHVSFADALIVGGAFRRPVRFVMDHRIYKQPALRWFFDAVGVIPIARAKDDPQMLEQAYERIESALRRGELVCIFPEGMITHDGALNQFRDGITRIVERTPVPVVPLALKGMWGSFFSRCGGPAMRRLPRRFWSKIELVADRAISPTTVSAAQVQERVADLLETQSPAKSSRSLVERVA